MPLTSSSRRLSRTAPLQGAAARIPSRPPPAVAGCAACAAVARVGAARRTVALRLVVLAALLASALLAADAVRSGRGFCPLEEACSTARASALGAVFGVPTAWVGLAAFGALLGLTLLPGRAARTATTLAGVLAAVAGSGFLAYQALVLGRFCPFCVAADVAGIVTGAIVLSGPRAPPARGGVESSARRLAWVLTAGLVAAGPMLWPRAPVPAWIPVPAAAWTPPAAAVAEDAAAPAPAAPIEAPAGTAQAAGQVPAPAAGRSRGARAGARFESEPLDLLPPTRPPGPRASRGAAGSRRDVEPGLLVRGPARAPAVPAALSRAGPAPLAPAPAPPAPGAGPALARAPAGPAAAGSAPALAGIRPSPVAAAAPSPVAAAAPSPAAAGPPPSRRSCSET